MKIRMVAANLTGGEAEELRKAMGGKRSESIIAGLKARLYEAMTANGFDEATQAEVMRVLSTAREFMFRNRTPIHSPGVVRTDHFVL